MLKVVDMLKIGNMLSVTVEGNCAEIKNGSKLVDDNGKVYLVNSVGMASFENPHDISKLTTLLVTPDTLSKGTNLSIA